MLKASVIWYSITCMEIELEVGGWRAVNMT